jgi:hypothetical protein
MDKNVEGRERMRAIINRFARLSVHERVFLLEMLDLMADVPSVNRQEVTPEVDREMRVYVQDLMCALYREPWDTVFIEKLIASREVPQRPGKRPGTPRPPEARG